MTDPAGQFVHGALPLAVLYFISAQATQVFAFGPVKPALQVHAASVELAVGEIELSGHVVHVDTVLAPSVTEYVPATQLVHNVELLAAAVPEYVPGTQLVHTVELLAPAVAEYLPATQLMHSVELLAPAVSEYLPASQFMHNASPMVFLNLPATHGVH